MGQFDDGGSGSSLPARPRTWQVKAGIATACTTLALVVGLNSCQTVPAGYVGVVTKFGKVLSGTHPDAPGLVFKLPFIENIEQVSVQPQNHQFQQVQAASKEYQTVYVDGGVTYHLNADHASEVFTEGGVAAIVAKVFNPAFQSVLKEVVPNYPVADILGHRSDISDQVKQRLAALAAPYGITVDNVFLTNLDFSPQYDKAIEAKQVAAQKLAQAVIDAQTAKTAAEGTANAEVVTATADAKANQLRQKGLTPLLINYLLAQRWNGQTPQATGNAATIFGPLAGK
jgi:regulator of protease activity HflC (stomatin/prohibitin superfamily)